MNVLDFRILIVEDEFAYADALQDLIEESGYQVAGIAESAEEALKKIGKELPDLILMDIAIKGSMDGIELAKHIKSNIQDIPVIFITSFADEATFKKAKEAGPHSFITKPFDSKVLKRSVELAVSNISANDNVFENDEENGILAKDYLFVKVNGFIKKIVIDDIDVISIEDKHAVLYSKSKRFVVRKTLKEISDLLDPQVFTQVHRSHLINTHKIDSISLSNYEIIIENKKIPIGRVYKETLIERIQLI